MRRALLLAALVLAGCAAPALPPAGTDSALALPSAEEQGAPVVPTNGTVGFAVTGACVRPNGGVRCFGAAGYEEGEVEVTRNGTLLLRFEWTPATPQMTELGVYAVRSDEDQGPYAEGSSPLELALEVTPGTYVLGLYPSAPASGGAVDQVASWTATWADSAGPP